MRIGLYPGTFDPITMGHIDIIRRASAFLDRLVIGVAINRDKGPLFSLSERVAMIEAECVSLSEQTGIEIVVHPFENLLIDCARDVNATNIVRGMRADADFEYDPAEIPMLLEPIRAGKADVVFGSRFKLGAQVHRTFHYLINRFLTVLSNLLSGLYLSDMETCYKFFRAEIIQHIVLESNRFGFEPEVTAKVARLKLRVMELPISYFPRNYIEGKKINWKDGVAAVFHIVRFNLLSSPKESFLPSLPQQFVPKGTQWL